MMQLPFRTRADDHGYLEPAPSPLLPLSCLLAIIVAIVVLGVEIGARLALIAIAFAAVSLATRLPRVLPLAAALCLIIAAIAVLDGGGSPAVAAHALLHSRMGK